MSNKINTYVALLRGINVGGKATVNMQVLRRIFAGLGYRAVKTYINSGNVIFKTTVKDPRSLEATIEKQLEKVFNLGIKVVVRSLAEMDELIKQIPNSWHKNRALKCNVIFLHHSIDKPSLLDGIELKEGIEEASYHSGVIFWSARTGDLGRSNMLKLSSRPEYQNMTVRGLNTTKKIYELMEQAAKSADD